MTALDQDVSLTVELFVNDLAAARTFYTDGLGFTVVATEDTVGYAALRLGSVNLALKQRKKPRPAESGRPGQGTSLILEVPDVKAAFARFDPAGGELLSPLKTQPWGQTDFLVADPDGYRIRITSRA